MDSRKGNASHHPFHFLAQVLKVTVLIVIVLASVFAANQFKLSRYLPIKTVHIHGANHVDHQEIQTILMPLLNQGFFKVNVELVRDRLRQLPWVADLFVRRIWPDEVDIEIVEKVANARWNEESLLSDTGELFTPSDANYPSNLPQLMGPEGKQIVMLNYLNEINRILTPLHAKISYLELSSYDAWMIRLDNGMALQAGHKDILTRLQHFVKVYAKIIGNRAAEVEYIDLRYPNGVAVRWKTPLKT